MQIDTKLYDPALHDRYKALTVRQPLADALTRMLYIGEDGRPVAKQGIYFSTRKTNYRGELMVCSSAKPVIVGCDCGVTCGLVEVVDCKPVDDFTEDDWRQLGFPENARPRKGWGWIFKNPRRVVEMPIRGQLGIYDLVTPKDDITEYPIHINLDIDPRKI